MTCVARPRTQVLARDVGLVEMRIRDVESFEARLGLRQGAGRVAVRREALAPQAELAPAVGCVAVGAVHQRRGIVRHRHERVESHRVANRPRNQQRDANAERDRNPGQPLARREAAQADRQGGGDHRSQQEALRSNQGRRADRNSQHNEARRLRLVVDPVRAEQYERHEEYVERLRHQRRLGQEEHRVDGGERGRGQPDRTGRDPAAEQADEHHGAGPDEGEEDPLLLHGVGTEARRHREQQREERRVLRGRPMEMQQEVVEGPDIAQPRASWSASRWYAFASPSFGTVGATTTTNTMRSASATSAIAPSATANRCCSSGLPMPRTPARVIRAGSLAVGSVRG